MSTHVPHLGIGDFSLSISSTGVAHFAGDLRDHRFEKVDLKRRMQTSGEYTGVVDFKPLAEWVASQPFPDRDTDYNSGWIDSATETFWIVRNGHRIRLHNGNTSDAPALLFGLRSVLQTIIYSVKWWPDGPATRFFGWFAPASDYNFGVEIHPDYNYQVTAGGYDRRSIYDIFFGKPLTFKGDSASFDYKGESMTLTLSKTGVPYLIVSGSSHELRRVDVTTFYRMLNGGLR